MISLFVLFFVFEGCVCFVAVGAGHDRAVFVLLSFDRTAEVVDVVLAAEEFDDFFELVVAVEVKPVEFVLFDVKLYFSF